jgi:hypothetical protein
MAELAGSSGLNDNIIASQASGLNGNMITSRATKSRFPVRMSVLNSDNPRRAGMRKNLCRSV